MRDIVALLRRRGYGHLLLDFPLNMIGCRRHDGDDRLMTWWVSAGLRCVVTRRGWWSRGGAMLSEFDGRWLGGREWN